MLSKNMLSAVLAVVVLATGVVPAFATEVSAAAVKVGPIILA